MPRVPVNDAAKAAKKKAATKKAKVAKTAKLENMSGHDTKNGLVTLTAEGKGYRVIGERLGYNEFHATRVAAVGQYNYLISTSQRQL